MRGIATTTCLALALAVATPAWAQTTSNWNVEGNGDWNTAGNWSPSGVPNSADVDVIIDNNPDVNVIVRLNRNAWVRTLTIDEGDRLNVGTTRTLRVYDTINNDGMIGFLSEYATSTNSNLEVVETLTLQGSGQLRPLRADRHMICGTTSDSHLIQKAGHSITGAGNVRDLRFTNRGLVRADGEMRLIPGDHEFVNQGIYRAADGGLLRLYAGEFDNSGGIIEALDGGKVQLRENSHIIGGILQTAGSGILGSWAAGGTLQDVTNHGRVRVDNSSATTCYLSLQGTITNHGEIGFDTSYAARNYVVPVGTVTLQGEGELLLRHNIYSNVHPASGTQAHLINEAGHTIRGRGNVGTGDRLQLTNRGLISGDSSGGTLSLTPNNEGLANEGVLRAVNGGTLLLSGGAGLTNYDSATSTLTGGAYEVFANSTMRLAGVNIITNNADILLSGPGSNIYNATSGTTSALANFAHNAGAFTITQGRNFTTPGGLLNSGRLTVGPDSTLTLGGGGTLISTGTLAGVGTISGNVESSGTLAPGASVGTLTFSGDLLFDSGSVYDWKLSSTGHDMIDVLGELMFGLDATLNVSQFGSVLPDVGDYPLFSFGGTDPVLPAWTINMPTGWEHDGISILDNRIYLAITVVPEPATVALLAVGGAALLIRRRRA